ncbi:MAG TPA: hypothetical protein VK512_22935 [Xanthobacteraceae bacterium]|nr:hypothetical protein [Xanthobacteraceae bacterium]
MPIAPPFRRADDILRLRVLPDDPAAVTVRAKGASGKTSRRPHTDAKVAAVRRLIEDTALNYDEIAARTGVGRASISRWTRDQGWKRHPFAPRATDTVPTARAGRKLKLRLLGERLRALAERYVRALEETPSVDVDRLTQALEVLKMARVVAQGGRRKHGFAGATRTGAQTIAREEGIRNALTEMRRGGVDIDRAPQEALDLLIDAHRPPEGDHPALRPRGWRRR